MASKSKTRTKSKQTEEKQDESIGLKGDLQFDENDAYSTALLNKIEHVLDAKIKNLIDEVATKKCISSLRETILEQAQTIEKLKARCVILESYVKQIEKIRRT